MPTLTHPPLFDFPKEMRWLKCHFCGERIKSLDNGHIELCAIRDNGTLGYPSDDQNFTIILGHGKCGPDVGYHFSLKRLVKDGAEDWINHLHTKRWWGHEFDDELREAEQYARLIAKKDTGDDELPKLPEGPSRGQPTMFSTKLPRAPKAARNIKTSMRAFVMERDGFKCRRCNASSADGARLVVDHIVPVAKGGTGDHDNLQTLCWDCNSGKSDRDPHQHDLRQP